jgi:hypothetical protein
MTTQEHCRKLLEQVERAGEDPQLAYLVRTRLRRALVGLERGRRDGPGGLLADAPSEVRHLVSSLGVRVASLCQPSEALDVRWRREWGCVLSDVERLRHWVDTQPVD